MGNNIPDMVDMAFDLKGSFVPAGYVFSLWNEVARILPWLEAEELAGILPLRGSHSGNGLLLANRSKLVLRLPVRLVAQTMVLSGQSLNIGRDVLQIGEGRQRPLQAHATLHANLVESDDEEEQFIADVATQLNDMKITCKWICGQHHTAVGAGLSLSGYSLVLHDLKPDASLHVQRVGLGGSRRFGCGIFVPYKDISGLD